MNITKSSIVLAALVVSGLGITAASSAVQAAQAEKTNECGISGLVHEEQQQVGGVQGGNFGRAVGEFNSHGGGSTPEAHESQVEAATTCRNSP
jgi:hypothetical protein